jgi:tRNA-modifying protein YgfZ
MSVIALASRGVVRVSGPDAETFLNGLLTNDVTRAGPSAAVYAAMLTPQGKYLFDLFILQPEPQVFWLDVARAPDFTRRLMMYRLRSKVVIEDLSAEYGVYAALRGTEVPEGAHSFVDPRLEGLGHRVMATRSQGAREQAYLAHCIALGVPNPATDLVVDKDFIMEGLFDELNGLDHHKGCYVGQEMTSRMKRRTSVKNKLCRIRFDGPPPAFETPIMADGWEVGRIRSCIDGIGIALIRFDRARKAILEGHELMVGDVAATLDPPDWLEQPKAQP